MNSYDLPLIDCEVTFLPEARSFVPSLNGDGYRPHIVIGDPNQREPILSTRTIEITGADGNKRPHTTNRWIDEEYIGVAFHSGPTEAEMQKATLGKQLHVQLTLMFWPGPQYEKIKEGSTFTIREGGKIVGFGKVLKIPFSFGV